MMKSPDSWIDRRPFELAVIPPPGDPGGDLLRAVARAGELPIVDAARLSSPAQVEKLVAGLRPAAGRRLAVRIEPAPATDVAVFRTMLRDGVDTIIVGLGVGDRNLPEPGDWIAALRGVARRILCETLGAEDARCAVSAGADGVVALGNEAGGRVGDETTFVLLQRLHRSLSAPIWVRGVVGPNGAAAALAAGASGIVLEGALGLAEECSLDERLRSLMEAMDGSETVCLGESLGHGVRVHRLVSPETVRALTTLEAAATGEAAFADALREAIRCDELWAIGQDAAFAGRLATVSRSAAEILGSYRRRAVDNLRSAAAAPLLGEDSPLARAHGTRYPIVQGPMTRVSDTPDFVGAVAAAGALPFLALALMRGEEVGELLRATAAALGDRPWGVGILGFVPPELRAEQLAEVLAVSPPFALLAGGRPDQAAALEEAGIATYLHAPSPGLLRLFLQAGARRFVLEGRECGGHVGPLGSLVLWESALEVLMEHRRAVGDEEPVDVLLAGGIHDGLGAAMAAALAAPAAAAGIRIGVLMGTAYLFTREAVATGALLERFQEAAAECRETVLLDAGGGHAVRCAPTPFAGEFRRLRGELIEGGASPEEVRQQLEEVNVGRLRLASKGLVRDDATASLVPADPDRQWREGMYMVGQVAALRAGTVTVEELHREVSEGCARELTSATRRLGLERTAIPLASPPDDLEPIAIIGMACLFPGAEGLDQFWRNVVRNHDAVREVPSGRWRGDLLYSPDPDEPDRVVSRWGGFLDPVVVDPVGFGIPPASCAAIEPMHLLTLEAVRRALVDAGYDRRPFPRDRTAVIFGTGGGSCDLGLAYQTRCMAEHYLERAPQLSPDLRRTAVDALREVLPRVTEDSFPGILGNVTAGRVANRFDLGGPNYTVDAACASSLAALDAAVRELRHGTSDMAVVGGVDGQQNAFGFLLFSKTRALSPRGRCRPFDAAADGTTIGEGVGVLILKRLGDAVRDGDRVYALVRSVGSSSDGRDKSLTAPSVRGQRRALERAYAEVGIDPASVGLVEAHGTGTVVGDRAELETLRGVFHGPGARPQSCALGSVKSQIGHLKNAAGAAALTKVAKALHHRLLPPTLVDEPSETARDRTSVFYLNTHARPWFEPRPQPRRAGVSAFGFGGTNFHAILEEYPPHGLPWCGRDRELLVLRAATSSELSRQAAELAAALEPVAPDLGELAHALLRRAEATPGRWRLAVIATTTAELAERLRAAGAALSKERRATNGRGWLCGEEADPGAIAFLFPGQGSQYPDMLADLASTYPAAREVFERADRELAELLPEALSSVVFPPPAHSEEEVREQRRRLDDTRLAQPALGAADSAVLALLERLGIRPDMVAGHSYGEYVALHAAGALSFSDLMRLSERRGRLVHETQGSDCIGMVAVAAAPEAVSELVARHPGVAVAGCNAPDQTIVGGPRRDLEAFVERLDERRLASRRLPLSAGFHIPHAAAAAELLAVALEAVPLGPPRVPVYSNLEASPYPGDPPQMRRILIDQLTHPVRFRDQVEAMYGAGARLFVEVGPGRVLSGLARRTLGERPARVLAVDSAAGGDGLLRVVAELLVAGRALRWRELFAGSTHPPRESEEVLRPPSPPAATAILVDGGSISPVGTPPPQAAPSFPTRPELRATAAPPDEAASAPDGGVLPEVVARALAESTRRFLESQRTAQERRERLMLRFLETQREIIALYGSGATATPRPHPADVAATHSEAPAPPAEPAPEAAPPAPAAGPADLERLVIEVISERTGYPTEMLEPDLNLEADLGIDSIKRTEIFGTVRERLGLGEGRFTGEEFFLAISRLRTLREVLGWLAEQGAAVGDGVTSSPGAPPSDPTPPIGRFVVAAEPAPLESGRTGTAGTAGLTLVTGSHDGLGRQVVTALRGMGVPALLLRHGGGTRRVAADEYQVDLGLRTAVLDLKERTSHEHGPVAAICHLQPLAPEIPAPADDVLELTGIIHLATVFGADLREAGGSLVAAAPLDGAFAGNGSLTAFRPGAAAVTGFLKALAHEWPEVRIKCVALDPATEHELVLGRLLAEATGPDPRVEVGYGGAGRSVLRATPAPLDRRPATPLALDERSVVLATGGARGITAVACAALAERYHPRFILVGRTGEPPPEGPETAALTAESDLKRALAARQRRHGGGVTPAAIERECRAVLRAREMRTNLARLRALAPLVELHAADVRDRGSLSAVVAGVYERFGRLDGVIHGAGVVDDRLLLAKSERTFAEVFDTKVRAALTLAAAVRPQELAFMVMFSSLAARFGYAGGTDYSAANDALNRLAWVLDREWRGRVVAIGWGPWDEVGIASRYPTELHARQGLVRIPVALGREHFLRELECGRKGEPEVLIYGSAGGEPYAST